MIYIIILIKSSFTIGAPSHIQTRITNTNTIIETELEILVCYISITVLVILKYKLD